MKKLWNLKKKSDYAPSKKRKYQAYQKGLWAERLAELFLRLKGYRCLQRRYKTPLGEIDLVMRKGKYLVGVEVKARAKHHDAVDCLQISQQRRITQALELFQVRHNHYHHCALRCDFILLVGFKMCHIKGAWHF